MPVMRSHLVVLLVVVGVARCLQTQTSADIQSQIEANENDQKALNTIHARAWVDSPSVRGTTDILWTCIITLTSCVYTVLHLNIRHSSTWNKLQWVAITLFIPEFILLLASRQFIEAFLLKRKLNLLLSEQACNSTSTPKSYDLKTCFFAVMGGFEAPIADIEPGTGVIRDNDYNWPLNLTLSATGILELARLGYFIEVDTASLEDRSKATLLQKFLVSTQVIWMAIQCIVKKRLGLPIALLEIHVMVHVVFALLLYGFWFYKPLDIEWTQTITVESEEIKNALAFMIQCQFCHLQNETAILYPDRGDDRPMVPRIVAKRSFGKQDPRSSRCEVATDQQGEHLPVQWITPTADDVRISEGQALSCGVGYLHIGLVLGREKSRLAEERSILLNASDITRTERATYSQCFVLGGNIRETLSIFQDSFSHPADGGADEGMGSTTEVFRFILSVIGEELTWYNLLRTGIFPIIYGGIHLSAWNYDFASRQEEIMWKVSCLIIVGFIPWVGLYFLFFAYVGRPLRVYIDPDLLAEEVQKSPLSVGSRMAGICILGFTVSLFAAVHFFARVFIVVEAFISLRQVPIGVYSMPSWIQMIPHL
ncbi:hypothetical protein HER10_EVM0005233 [Colletotrichum scovillei]|uniref:uncharacterized protein n=1 Tax=Colletotrichum scovillei TaxID=1209932 RepID=UPI0015C37489|nr:uncharacterized protein HER10_EVM0005233 [Colletotrichum scovillei]KAF4784190.1 hypothetical protein HER10_EVM0005233 [Colletotrichum scovillei]